eukprot:CAMPEP_0181308344 /NCGR_PEP_ID=MMETSP1101-20121128/11411_1 /TAXON_ID=46948 /ORGANISM="Rhodomonas abbreviata, Strain Caron Lab Isolate" /LENGTH=167 /DNA_ID=CAMNT_0023414717 /DNA_START=13 /DNA_END=516 /DNA_ORIENTATION=-
MTMYGATPVAAGTQEATGQNSRRYAAIAALSGAAVLLGALALVLSNTASPVQTDLEGLPFIAQKSAVTGISNRAHTDLDPGSLAGLMQAAEGDGMGGNGLGAGRTTQLGMETEGDELAQLQQQETTQSDRRASDAEAPSIRKSIGRTIAKYFTTVRSVKDDQGTFLG